MYKSIISIFIFIIVSSCTRIEPAPNMWNITRIIRYTLAAVPIPATNTVTEATSFTINNYRVYYTAVQTDSLSFYYPLSFTYLPETNKLHLPYLGTFGNVNTSESNLLVFDGFSDFISYAQLYFSNITHESDFPIFTNRLIGGTVRAIRYRDVTSGLCPVAFDKAGTYDIRPASMQDFSFYTGTLTVSDITELQDFTNGLPAYNVHLTVISNPIQSVSMTVSNIQSSPDVYYYRILLSFTNSLVFSWKDVAARILEFPVLVSGMVEDDRTGVLYSGRYLSNSLAYVNGTNTLELWVEDRANKAGTLAYEGVTNDVMGYCIVSDVSNSNIYRIIPIGY